MDKIDAKKVIVLFNGAISNAAKTSTRKAIRKALNPKWTNTTLQAIADVLNPKIRGWINCYGKFFKGRMIRIFDYLEGLIQRWIANKYKLISKAKTVAEYKRIKAETPLCSITGNLE